jgi:eukaryotic-like serine/threonine-protein kinase
LNTCPSHDQLRSWLDEGLDEASDQAVATHVEVCAACQQSLDRLTTLVAGNAGPGPEATREAGEQPQSTEEWDGDWNTTLTPETSAQQDLGRLRYLFSAATTAQRVVAVGGPRTTAWPQVPGYEVLGELGMGGMGVVYKARHLRLNRLVALKMILAGDQATPEQLIRFGVEAETVARLAHPNIVQIFEVGSIAGKPYLALEYLSGGSLAEKLAGKPLPPREAAALVEVLARAIQHAHEQGVIHRDLKPPNVLLTHDGDPKVADFGLARLQRIDLPLTRTGTVAGTPSYMAPEQVRGRSAEVSPAVDVYALGAVLYECLTGRPPFFGESHEVLLQVTTQDPVPPSRLVAGIPRDLETVCLKALEKAPTSRYGSALALAQDCAAFLRGAPVTARRVTVWGRAARWARRRPAVAGLLSALVLIGSLGLGAVLWQWDQAVRGWSEADKQERLANQRADSEVSARREAGTALYVSLLRRAELEWRDHNVTGARQALAECPSEERGWDWYHLNRVLEGSNRSLRVHSRGATAAAVSADGRHLATADDDGVRVWDAATGAEKHLFPAKNRAVMALAFSPDSKRLAAGGDDADGAIRLWDVDSGRETTPCRGHTRSVTALAFAPDGQQLASASWDGTVRIWAPDTGRVLSSLPTAGDIVRAMRFSADGQRVGTLTPDKFKVWEVAGGKELRSFSLGEGNAWNALAIATDLRRLATAGNRMGEDPPRARVALWDTEAGQEVFTRPEPDRIVWCVAFSPDGSTLAVACKDGSIVLRDPATGAERRMLRGHAGRVWAMDFSSDGRQLLSAATDGARLWKVDGAPASVSFENGVVVACHPDGRLAVVSASGSARLCDRSGNLVRSFPTPRGRIHALAFSPDGERLAAACSGIAEPFPEGHEVVVWDVATGRELVVCRGHSRGLRTVAFSPDGRRLASGAGDATWRLWDADTGKQLLSGQVHHATLRAIAFSPDGRRVVTGGTDGKVHVWDTEDGRELSVYAGKDIDAVAYSPDGRWLAWADDDGVRVLEADSGTERFRLIGTGRARGLAFHSDSTRLATLIAGTSAIKPSVVLHELATGRLTLTLKGEGDHLFSLAFSPDGAWLAGAGDKVTVWDGRPRP